MLTPWRYSPIAAAAINPNTAPDAPPAMPLFGWMTSSPSEPASSAAKYSSAKRMRPSARLEQVAELEQQDHVEGDVHDPEVEEARGDQAVPLVRIEAQRARVAPAGLQDLLVQPELGLHLAHAAAAESERARIGDRRDGEHEEIEADDRVGHQRRLTGVPQLGPIRGSRAVPPWRTRRSASRPRPARGTRCTPAVHSGCRTFRPPDPGGGSSAAPSAPASSRRLRLRAERRLPASAIGESDRGPCHLARPASHQSQHGPRVDADVVAVAPAQSRPHAPTSSASTIVTPPRLTTSPRSRSPRQVAHGQTSRSRRPGTRRPCRRSYVTGPTRPGGPRCRPPRRGSQRGWLRSPRGRSTTIVPL